MFLKLFKVEDKQEINIFRNNRHKGFPFQMKLPVSKQVIKAKIITHRKALKKKLSLFIQFLFAGVRRKWQHQGRADIQECSGNPLVL